MDAKTVRELFDYDPETGTLTWRVDRPQRIKAGDIAGCLTAKGYVRVKHAGKNYAAHRLIFLWMEGRWPEPDCDHEDLDKSNNRWVNLREATKAENRHNRLMRKDSTTGFKGVVRRNPNHRTRNFHPTYQARLKVNGRVVYGKCHRTVEEAHEEHTQLVRQHHGPFSRS